MPVEIQHSGGGKVRNHPQKPLVLFSAGLLLFNGNHILPIKL